MAPSLAELQQALVAYVALPHAQLAVIGPLIVSLSCLHVAVLNRALTKAQVIWFLVALPCSMLTVHWRETSETLSLHSLDFFALVAVWLGVKHKITPGIAYALTFFSLFILDVWGSWQRFGYQSSESLGAYQGIGGAAAGDALFLLPAFMAGAVWLMQQKWAREIRIF